MNIARGRFKSSANTVRRLASVAANQPRSTSSCRPSFPCVDRHEERQRKWLASASSSTSASSSSKTPFPGPEPPYSRPSPLSYSIYHHTRPLDLVYGSTLPAFDIAYETWGNLNADKSNAILLHTGLSASSHAAATADNAADGWWQKFIGPGKALDTNKYFIICTNVLGGCYGSTGPSSVDPATGEPYGTTFPVLSIHDMIRTQFHLLDDLGIRQLYASVGSSMGAMQSLAAGWLFPDRVARIVSISGTARSSPSSIAMRFAQRSGEPHTYMHPSFPTLSSADGRSKLE
jgi:homoserine acetyltransferase